MKKTSIKIILFLMICISILPIFRVKKVKVLGYDNSSEIVMDCYSNLVIHEKNANQKKFMASTTKILTAICVIENSNLNDVVTVTCDTVGVEGSSIYLKAGEKLTVKELLYGLMLRSGNDCAETLAKFCGKTIENFVKIMNETAKKIGAINSNFINPHGLHDDKHYTTAYDLALISSYAMKNDTFREIVSTKKIKISNTLGDYDRILINKNKLLKNLEGCTGIKTGFTKKAGRCLVSSCKKDGREFIVVVLNCPNMFERSKELLTESFNNYENIKLVNSEHILGFIYDCKNEKHSIAVKRDIILPIKSIDKDKIKIEYDYQDKIDKVIKRDQEVGQIKIYLENRLIFSQKIYTI